MSSVLHKLLTLSARKPNQREDEDGIEFTEHPAVKPTNAEPKIETIPHIRIDRPAGAQAAVTRPTSSGIASSAMNDAPRNAPQPSNGDRSNQVLDPDRIAPVQPTIATSNIANLLEDRRLMFQRLRNPKGAGSEVNLRESQLTNGLPN